MTLDLPEPIAAYFTADTMSGICEARTGMKSGEASSVVTWLCTFGTLP